MVNKKVKIIISLFFVVVSMVSSPIYVKAENLDTNIYNAPVQVMAKAPTSCDQALLGCVDDDKSVAWLLQKILNYIKILGPTAAIALGTIDFAKAIIISDEENMKKTESRFIKRIIAAMLLFFVPLLVQIFLGLVGITGTAATGGLS